MKSLLFLLILIPGALSGRAQSSLGVQYDPSIQSTSSMQYFKPKGDLFVGDCIPFSKDGVYYYYWLLDSAHHKSLNGLGGHQWALSTSSDLRVWKQFPVVLGIDEAWEKSICTGSVVFHQGKYYAFYATRLINAEGKVNEQLSYAISNDGVHFDKQKPNPFYTSAPGYSKRNFRDPKVFVDQSGEFHLFVSSEEEKPVMADVAGCLVHLSSQDLQHWTVHEPILTGQGSVPECPDYFYWNGWYYLVYSDNSNTSYVKSRKPYGPWEAPRYQALNEDWSNVVKTAAFTNGRRIAAAWVPSRAESKDDMYEIFGGNSLFREVIQQKDGTLDTRWPAEMIPVTGDPMDVKLRADIQATFIGGGSASAGGSRSVGSGSGGSGSGGFGSDGSGTGSSGSGGSGSGGSGSGGLGTGSSGSGIGSGGSGSGGLGIGSATAVKLHSPGGVAMAHIDHVPANARITIEFEPVGANEEYGVYLKSDAAGREGYRLKISASNRMVSLGNTTINGVEGLEKRIKVDIIMKDGILDADIDHRRTIVNRTYEQHGDVIWLYAKHGEVNVRSVAISPLKD